MVDHRHIACTQRVADFIDGKNAVGDRCRGADGDQRIHVGRALPQCFEAHLEILAVYVHNRQQQKKLGKCKRNPVLCAVECVFDHIRHRQADPLFQHVVHRQVHQRYPERERHNQPRTHGFQLFLHRVHGLLRGRSRPVSKDAGAVARAFHR